MWRRAPNSGSGLAEGARFQGARRSASHKNGDDAENHVESYVGIIRAHASTESQVPCYMCYVSPKLLL